MYLCLNLESVCENAIILSSSTSKLGRFSFGPVQPVKMQMAHADQTDNLFLFQLVRMEITVPFGQNFHVLYMQTNILQIDFVAS